LHLKHVYYVTLSVIVDLGPANPLVLVIRKTGDWFTGSRTGRQDPHFRLKCAVNNVFAGYAPTSTVSISYATIAIP
jgi:hypothetical protein